MSKVEPNIQYSLDDLLKKLLAAIPEVETAAIVSAEGLPIISILPQGIDETKISAMVAALQSLSKKAITEIQRGDFEQLYIKSSDGYILILQAGPNTILMVSADKDIRLRDFFPSTPFPYIFNPPNPPDDLDSVG
jgi:predicted regulator of Ras-like GTPase activity (Roadblock/LC7/MglB family)